MKFVKTDHVQLYTHKVNFISMYKPREGKTKIVTRAALCIFQNGISSGLIELNKHKASFLCNETISHPFWCAIFRSYPITAVRLTKIYRIAHFSRGHN